MDHLQKLTGQIKRYLFLVMMLENLVLAAVWWVIANNTDLSQPIIAGIISSLGLLLILLFAGSSARHTLRPLGVVWQTILHALPSNRDIPAPDLTKLHVGKEMVTALTAQIEELADPAAGRPDDVSVKAAQQAEALLLTLPLPLLVLDSQQRIIYANKPAAAYLEMKRSDFIGQDIHNVCTMAFSSDETLEDWLDKVRTTKALAGHSWSRVRLKAGEVNRQFDLAAHYSHDNSIGAETTLMLFDHTGMYDQDDQGLSFVAMSVHELRTPLTLLRGYIEVFEDELGESLTPELKDFMHKMGASAEQLTAFVSNILNVARIANDQLELSLEEADWGDVLTSTVANLELRARVRGIELHCDVEDNLPKVGVDRVSIYEVLNNLLDNAIKYSGDSKKISIDSHLTKDGLVETTVQDWGVGIPTGIMPNLFNRFYRNYRNRSQVGGTGLGLYLCKAIVGAHGGNIWARSHEGEGSTFGFTVVPFSQLSDQQRSGSSGIIRGAHGWIKNHSLSRG